MVICVIYQVTALYVCILSCHEALKVGSDLLAVLIFIFFHSLSLTAQPLKKGSLYVKSESVCVRIIAHFQGL